ncbi:MAG TPA: type II toxin-antitoxin system VapC family toxin [Thermoanaerobaculia bacterium]|jgi:tRNA(fMet)-specific endonuclease VapC|nr:type II toxin-antitoxin system VapC family toxin [Thermoanaerobaculia bacterium]
MYLLDTNACIRILNGTSPPLIERLRTVPRSQMRLSSVVKAELLYGARKSSRVAENLRLLERFFETITGLPFDDRCAEDYGLLREELDRMGTPIGPSDLLIAATARAHRAVLVTHNVREFSRVAELRVEDWESR